MTHALKFLNDFADNLISEYKDAIPEVTGVLKNSIRGKVSTTYNGYVITITLDKYWRWLEYGRGAGKQPPLQNIIDWIERKPIVPQVNNSTPTVSNRVPTVRQIAFAIARHIGLYGTKANYYFRDTFDSLKDELIRGITEALQKDTKEQLLSDI